MFDADLDRNHRPKLGALMIDTSGGSFYSIGDDTGRGWVVHPSPFLNVPLKMYSTRTYIHKRGGLVVPSLSLSVLTLLQTATANQA
jgi:hypothetical protein